MKSTFICVVTAGFGAFLLAATASPALAQASRTGATFMVKPFVPGEVVRYPAVAYDAANDAFLVVYGLQKHGARFVSADGVPLGAPTRLSTVDGGATRVACGAEINACLVAWIQEPATIMGRLVRYNAGNVQLLSAAFVINTGALKLTSAAPSVAYSSTSNEFLVAWTDIPIDVRAQRVTGTGELAGSTIQVATTPAGWEGMPSIAYNSTRDEFTVSHYLEMAGVASGVGLKRVQPGTGAVLSSSVLYASVFEQYPDMAYNSRQDGYLAVTWGFAGNKWMLHGQLADGAGQAVGGIIPLALNGGGDGIGVAYNPVSNNYLAVYLHHDSPEIFGVTVSSAGVPGMPFQVTVSGTKLATKPQIAGSKTNPRFLAVASDNFGQAMAQLVQDGAAAPVSSPVLSLDTAPGGNVVPGQSVSVAGWAVDFGATQGTGVDAVHAWAWPVSGGAPIFVGAAAYGVSRPDVAGALGHDRFSGSGFNLSGTIDKPGTYDLAVYARSTVAQAFNSVKVVRITVQDFRPYMWIDFATPAGSAVTISGWAIDAGSPDSSGIDAIHLWAYRVDGLALPRFFGVGSLGVARPDVAAAFGGPQFASSGFVATGTLDPGVYDIAVHARSRGAEQFNNVRVVRVHVP